MDLPPIERSRRLPTDKIPSRQDSIGKRFRFIRHSFVLRGSTATHSSRVAEDCR